jgi:hypothetical protein
MNRGFRRNLLLVFIWCFHINFAWFAWLVAWLDGKIKFRLPFPRDTDELANKKQWCITILKKNGVLPVRAVVTGYKVIALNQENIFRSNISRVEIDYTINGENRTLKCMAKFAPVSGTVWNRAVFNMQINHVKEIYFNKYFVHLDKLAASPAVYYAEFALVTGNLCLIMEYMGDDKEYPEGPVEDILADDLYRVLDAMASLHARYWKNNSAKTSKIFPIMPFIVDFFDSMVAHKWSLPARKILVQSWCHSNEPQTVIHGDARIGNMMFPADKEHGRFVFIDWQAARKSKGAFDLAYFLMLSFQPSTRLEIEQQSIDTYFRLLCAKGVNDYTRDELEEDYKHACLCVLVLLSLPMLSGEASAEGKGAIKFAWGMDIWRKLMQEKFAGFDYVWLTDRYGITGQEGRDAIAEMLKVIEDRLKRINEGAAV